MQDERNAMAGKPNVNFLESLKYIEKYKNIKLNIKHSDHI